VRDTDCKALQKDQDNVVLWAQKWQTKFNVKRCKVMHVGRQTDCYEYYMGVSKLTDETLEKDLNVLILTDMKCSQCTLSQKNVTLFTFAKTWLNIIQFK